VVEAVEVEEVDGMFGGGGESYGVWGGCEVLVLRGGQQSAGESEGRRT
jgi:hypothetical protein